MEPRTKFALGAAVMLGIGGWFAWQRTETPRSGTVENPWAPIPLEVRYQEQSIATVTTKEAPITVRAPRGAETVDALRWGDGKLEEAVDTPCGRRFLSVISTSIDSDDAGGFRAKTSEIGSITAFVDNRGGPARTLRIGTLELAVAGNAVFRQPVYTDPCDGTVVVMLDGASLGPMDVKKSLLVDPTGKRCYSVREVYYGLPMFAPDPKPPELLSPKKLREVSSLTSVLEPAPERVQTIGISADRKELMEVPCGEP